MAEEPKVFFSDITDAREKAVQFTKKVTEKGDILLRLGPALREEVPAAQEPRLFGDEDFTFEKSRVHRLQLSSQDATCMNDEGIEKLKESIQKARQKAEAAFDTRAAVARGFVTFLILLDLSEIICATMVGVVLWLQSFPRRQLCLWIGCDFLLTGVHLYLLAKAILICKERLTEVHCQYMQMSIVFCVFALALSAFATLALCGALDNFKAGLTPELQEVAFKLQALLLCAVNAKLLYQLLLLCFSHMQIRSIRQITSEHSTTSGTSGTFPIQPPPQSISDSHSQFPLQGHIQG
jgi:hypothetical protein